VIILLALGAGCAGDEHGTTAATPTAAHGRPAAGRPANGGGKNSTGSHAASPRIGKRAVARFDEPVYVAHAPGAPTLLFVVERAGVIRVARAGRKLAHPFLDIRPRVISGGEQGLLSMAFDPGYRHNRRFYVYFTNRDCVNGACNIEVDAFRRSLGSATRAAEGSRLRVIEVRHHQAGNHDGGQLQFGPDGDLYIGTGDGGGEGDTENNAQSKARLLGKILRIDPKPGGGYRVPQSNPYVGRRGRDAIFSRGLRNPFRFSLDSKTGDIWIGDVGGADWEEIDHETLHDAAGANFGWHVYEGPNPCGDCGFGPGTPPPPGYEPPVHAYPHAGSGEHGEVIIGGYVARDPKLPASVRGDYLYTDNGEGDLRAFDPRTRRERGLGVSVPSPTSFGEGAHHRLYVASGPYTGNGRVYRLVSR
jgi:glucose/arabinose dehydrogenase